MDDRRGKTSVKSYGWSAGEIAAPNAIAMPGGSIGNGAACACATCTDTTGILGTTKARLAKKCANLAAAKPPCRPPDRLGEAPAPQAELADCLTGWRGQRCGNPSTSRTSNLCQH